MKIIENEIIDIEYKVLPTEYKINVDPKKAIAHNEYRDMLIEILEVCSDKPTAIMLELLRRNIDRGAIEEVSPGICRLSKKYAEPM